MVFIRSVLFNIFYILWTVVVGTLYLPLLLLPARFLDGPIRFWLRGFLVGAWVFAGIRWRVEGRENLPNGPCILASKHQSAWETFFFHLLVDRPVYVLKKELFNIPLAGWYMRKTGMIGIDRKAGGTALKAMLRGADQRIAEGRPIILFPEGTRVPPHGFHPYQPGIAALYGRVGGHAPVVPVALNTGMFWPRKSFLKRPGEVVVRIMPPLPPGLDKKVFLETLRTEIDTATAELCGDPPPQVP
ncbi:MAG: acyl-phosphate glycerol 3-phosphate acyltransferase [Rhodospirillaceae bacterium BRH_c57]|nr:MAG: acyl-phosphate glycerol 3-phosphate acyltransferase [Rhodospirillaceae bacterium BRH_c57]